MLERFTDDARTVLVHAQRHARRLGHRYIGCEHLLLALVGVDQPASAVLRERGLTPGRVEEGIVRRAGTGAGAGLFADLDRAALASIGIDLDAVRARIDASFGPDALTRADRAVHRTRRRPGPARGRLIHRWRHRDRVRRVLPVRAVAPAPEGRYQAADQPAGHIPFTPGAKKCLREHAAGGGGPAPGRHRCRAHRARPARHEPGAGTSHPGRGRPVRPGVAGRDPGPLPPGKLTSRAAIVAPGPARGSLLFIRSGDAE